MKIKTILAWSSLLIMIACEKDITVKTPQQAVKLVVNSVTAVNRPFMAMVSKTAGILELATPESYLVSNAVVLLYVNNVVKDTFLFNPNTRSYRVKYNTDAKAGFTYRLKASAPGFITATAETMMPRGIIIQSITKRENVRADADGNIYDEVKIRFTDEGEMSNYYVIKFRRPFNNRGDIHYESLYCMRSLDPDIDRRTDVDPILFEDCIDREFMMADKHFNGAVKELIVFIRNHELQPVLSSVGNKQFRAVIELNNITAEHYKYRKSHRAYRDSQHNPFAEPVLVYSNIRNGYGLFSVYNLAIDTIR